MFMGTLLVLGFVFGECPRVGFPCDGLAIPHGKIDEMANGDGAGTDLHIAQAALPRLHAIDPVLAVVVDVGEFGLAVLGWVFGDGGRVGLEPITIDKERALFADKGDA